MSTSPIKAAFHHVKTSIKSSIKNFCSWQGLSNLCRKRRFRQSFPTETWQPSSRIKILDGTLDGGLDVVKCSFKVNHYTTIGFEAKSTLFSDLAQKNYYCGALNFLMKPLKMHFLWPYLWQKWTILVQGQGPQFYDPKTTSRNLQGLQIIL